MARAARTCARCPAIIRTGSLCTTCTRAAQRASDQRRPSSSQRGYSGPGHRHFRDTVLARDPICVLCRTSWANVADHHPISRRDLEANGEDPNDPRHGRGLCKRCHDQETARHQPGGWNQQ